MQLSCFEWKLTVGYRGGGAWCTSLLIGGDNYYRGGYVCAILIDTLGVIEGSTHCSARYVEALIWHLYTCMSGKYGSLQTLMENTRRACLTCAMCGLLTLVVTILSPTPVKIRQLMNLRGHINRNALSTNQWCWSLDGLPLRGIVQGQSDFLHLPMYRLHRQAMLALLCHQQLLIQSYLQGRRDPVT